MSVPPGLPEPGGFLFGESADLQPDCIRSFRKLLELLQIFVDNIIPILLVALVGFVVGRHFGIDPRPLGRLIFYVFSPALVFQSLATSDIAFTELLQLGLVMLLFVLGMAAIAYAVTRRSEGSRLERAGVILGAVSPNNGNMGLPLIGFAFGDEVFVRALMVFIIMAMLNNTIGVFVASSGRLAPRDAALSVARVPVVYALLLGLAFNALNFTMPPVLERSVGLAAQAAIPGMLVLLGLQLAQSLDISQFRLVRLGTGLRLLVSPLLATALVLLVGLQESASIAVIMQASMPIAVVTTIYASEFGLDSRLSSSLVLVSTLVSPLTLSVLIFMLRRVFNA